MLEFKFTQTREFQVWVHRLYGWGAALVLLGALFKLQYWPGAGLMLSIGMITECIIFFLSAFEPLEKKYEWENVFPELLDSEYAPESAAAPSRTPRPASMGLNIDEAQTDRLKEGIQKLGSSIDQLTSLSDVAQASSLLTENLSRAIHSIGSVSESADQLTESYASTAATISNINEQSKKGMESMAAGYADYKDKLGTLSKSLTAVNASFEMQLQDNERYKQSYTQLTSEINSLVGDVKKSVEQTQQLTTSMASLNDNVAQLNNVYGSMLTAVTSVLNR